MSLVFKVSTRIANATIHLKEGNAETVRAGINSLEHAMEYVAEIIPDEDPVSTRLIIGDAVGNNAQQIAATCAINGVLLRDTYNGNPNEITLADIDAISTVESSDEPKDYYTGEEWNTTDIGAVPPCGYQEIEIIIDDKWQTYYIRADRIDEIAHKLSGITLGLKWLAESAVSFSKYDEVITSAAMSPDQAVRRRYYVKINGKKVLIGHIHKHVYGGVAPVFPRVML